MLGGEGEGDGVKPHKGETDSAKRGRGLGGDWWFAETIGAHGIGWQGEAVHLVGGVGVCLPTGCKYARCCLPSISFCRSMVVFIVRCCAGFDCLRVTG